MAEGEQWPEEIGKLNRKSFNYYRAALVFCTVEDVRKDYAKITNEDDPISLVEAEGLIDRLKKFLGILQRYPPQGGEGDCRWSVPLEGQTRKGKRAGLSRLPHNWREMITNACPAQSEFAAPLLLSALVGLRPVELKHGVIVAVKRDHIVVRIRGAKVTAKNGQPDRGIAFPVDNVIAQRLARMVTERGKHGLFRVSIADPRKFCDFVRSLSRQLFPAAAYVVTPYSFRHGFAADQKAQRAGGEVLAKALGHVSARSQRAYGSVGQGRRPLVTITAVEAPRTVRALDRMNDYKAQQNKSQDSAPDMLPGC
jgi:hypothetical protein